MQNSNKHSQGQHRAKAVSLTGAPHGPPQAHHRTMSAQTRTNLLGVSSPDQCRFCPIGDLTMSERKLTETLGRRCMNTSMLKRKPYNITTYKELGIQYVDPRTVYSGVQSLTPPDNLQVCVNVLKI